MMRQMQLNAVLECSKNILCLWETYVTGVFIHTWSLYELSKDWRVILCDHCKIVSVSEVSAPFCFECRGRNFPNRGFRAVNEAISHKSVVFWIETAHVGHSGKWKKGNLSSWGCWEIGRHTSIFNMWVIFCLLAGVNVRPSSTVFYALHFMHRKSSQAIPKQEECL